MKRSKPHLVVRHYQPWRLRLAIAAVLLLLAVGLWFVFQVAREQLGGDYLEAISARDRLQEEVAQLQRQVVDLREAAIRFESSRQIDEHANVAVKESLAQLQQENQELREELEFYRNIVSPAKERPGIRIKFLKLDPGNQEGAYRYSFTLVHIQEMKKRHVAAQGAITVAIEGTRNGVPVVLDLAEVGSPKGNKLRYSIKYFKQFEGDLFLPQDFVPHSLAVQVLPAGSKGDMVEKKIDWPAAAGLGGAHVGKEQET